MNLYDIGYGVGVGVLSPYWLIRPKARRKVLRAFRERMGRVTPRDGDNPAIMIHAVSLGEVNATRALVAILQRERPDLRFIISTTTDTGFDRARELYGSSPATHIVRYPLDFSVSVNRLLDAMRPSVVVLMEGELWPNFLRECGWRDIPVILVNGRVTTSAFRSYKRIRPIVASMLEGLRGICVQGQTYADRFLELGAPPGRVLITGTMKFDTAPVGQGVSGALPLAESVGLRVGQERIWVCGSTGPGEEEAILVIYRELLMKFPRLRLVLVPRHPERFDEVAGLIQQARFRVVRRSERNRTIDPNIAIPPVVLGDTMGELRIFYSIADIVFVGRTLVDLGPRQRGSDMIEPAALSKPVIVGPWTDNFAEAVKIFLAADAMRVATDPESLAGQVADLLSHPKQAEQMGRRAATIVQVERGATERNAEVILGELNLVAPPQSGEGRPVRAPFPTLGNS